MIDQTWFETRDGDAASKLREWSSLIGIITAIVGNILISFALNIQRFAHIRLERDRERSSADGFSKRRERSYGTQQSQIAEERAQLNLNAPIDDDVRSERGSHTNGKGASNGHKPSIQHTPSFRSRSSSNSTTKPLEKSETAGDSKSYLSSPYWWAGILLMIIGEAGNFLAYGFAPASIVSPLGVVALVSNCIIAPCLLKERFRQRDFWGVVVAIGGAVTVVLSANNSESKMGPHELWSAITRWEFELYLGITAAFMIVLMWVSGKYGEKSILIDLGLVGLFGGYTALSTKGVASLLSDTLWRTLTFPITYLLVFVLVVTAFLQIRYVNRALQRFDSTQVIPTQFVLFTLSVIIGSAVLYRDFKSATADQFGKFIGGCALTFLGVYLITSGRTGGKEGHDHMDGVDEEEGIGLVDEEQYEDANSEEDRIRQKSMGSAHEGPSLNYYKSSSRRQSESTSKTPRSISSTGSNALVEETEGPDAPLLKNPWRTLEDVSTPPPRPRPFDNTISSPLLPSEAQRSCLTMPQGQSPRRQSYEKANRPATLSRNSLSRMMPGPYIAPLSSPLSAIVADSLRRGLDSPTFRRRSRLPGLQTLRSHRSPGESAAGEADGGLSSPLKSAQEPAGEARMSSRQARSQSMSATLGEFFRIERNRQKSNGGSGGDTNDNDYSGTDTRP